MLDYYVSLHLSFVVNFTPLLIRIEEALANQNAGYKLYYIQVYKYFLARPHLWAETVLSVFLSFKRTLYHTQIINECHLFGKYGKVLLDKC